MNAGLATVLVNRILLMASVNQSSPLCNFQHANVLFCSRPATAQRSQLPPEYYADFFLECLRNCVSPLFFFLFVCLLPGRRAQSMYGVLMCVVAETLYSGRCAALATQNINTVSYGEITSEPERGEQFLLVTRPARPPPLAPSFLPSFPSLPFLSPRVSIQTSAVLLQQ